jgi:hypothetical protein
VKLIIDPDIAAAFPELRIGVVIARGIDNRGDDPRIEAIREQAALAVKASPFAKSWGAHPHVAAWREVYRALGINPEEDHCDAFPPGTQELVPANRFVATTLDSSHAQCVGLCATNLSPRGPPRPRPGSPCLHAFLVF